MITVALSVPICASHERVWRALVDPKERLLWDERLLGEVALSQDSEQAKTRSRQHSAARTRRRAHAADGESTQAPSGSTPNRRSGKQVEKKASIRTTRWRFRFGGIPLVMQEEVIAADRHDRLMSRVSIGTVHFDQTLTFHSEDDETGPRTRLGMKIIARNSIAVIGDVVERLDVQKIIIEYVDTTLRQAQKHCEQKA